MAINQNHQFEDLNGRKCAIVEKNCLPSRADFLKSVLDINGYETVVVPSPPAKVATTAVEPVADIPTVETFTIGVTDVTFNATNAIFGRLLKTSNGHVVTLNYWQQKEIISRDDIPYFDAPGKKK